MDFAMTPLSVVVANIKRLDCRNSTLYILTTKADAAFNRFSNVLPECDLFNEKPPRPAVLVRQEIHMLHGNRQYIYIEMTLNRSVLVILDVIWWFHRLVHPVLSQMATSTTEVVDLLAEI